MSKNPSREYWLRRGALLCWAVFRYNGDGTLRVTAVETRMKAYDLASVQRPEATQLYRDLKAKGFVAVGLGEVERAGMNPLRLLQEVSAISGSEVRRNPVMRKVVRSFVVVRLRRHL